MRRLRGRPRFAVRVLIEWGSAEWLMTMVPDIKARSAADAAVEAVRVALRDAHPDWTRIVVMPPVCDA